MLGVRDGRVSVTHHNSTDIENRINTVLNARGLYSGGPTGVQEKNLYEPT